MPKPLRQSDRCEAIAEGFTFYGFIYRFLAAMFFVSGFVVWVCGAGALFWWLSFLLVGVYLWIVAGLAFSGALQFRSSGGERIWSLVAFLFFVTLFLTAVMTAIGLKARMDGLLPDAVIFVFAFGMFAFGIGSYLVELAALVADKRPQEATVK